MDCDHLVSREFCFVVYSSQLYHAPSSYYRLLSDGWLKLYCGLVPEEGLYYLGETQFRGLACRLSNFDVFPRFVQGNMFLLFFLSTLGVLSELSLYRDLLSFLVKFQAVMRIFVAFCSVILLRSTLVMRVVTGD